MILLRYGIRCSLHYSVPLTLGLIAYTGSWQGVARNLMSDSQTGGKRIAADGNATKVADEKDDTAKSATSSGLQDLPAGESLAMNPETSETPRSFSIPRADSRRSRESIPESASTESARARIDSDRPPRDRDIDATGHHSPIVKSEQDGTAPALSAGMAAGAAGLAFVAVNSQDVAKQELENATAKPQKTIEDKPAPLSDPIAAVASSKAPQAGSKAIEASSAKTAYDANPTDAAASEPTTSVADEHGVEPAHLNPQIRAIAADVPSAASAEKSTSQEASKPAESTEIRTANQATEPVQPSDRSGQEELATAPALAKSAASAEKVSQAIEPASPESSQDVARNDPKPEGGKIVVHDRTKTEIPDFVIAQEGETWNRIAERIYGDELMAETIWRENRDAHGGTSEALPIAGRMVRLPELGKRSSIPNAAQTQLARTAR